MLARLARAAGLHGRAAGRGPHAEAHRPDARRVIIKAHVAQLRAGGAKAAALHLRYIERDGVEQDGSKGVLYGPDGPVRREVFEQPRADERHQFRLIVSPEDAGQLDLTTFVRRLMDRVEKDIGRKVEWAAVNHYDTDNPHAHVVIRGVGLDGEELRFDRSYIARGMRWRAQELVTQELGPRHELEVRRAREREVAQERFTSLDRELERLADAQGRLELRSRAPHAPKDPSLLLARLEQLEAMRLVERLGRNEWSFAEGWQKQLRDLGARGDILKEIHEVVRGDTSRYHRVRTGEALPDIPDGTPLVGRVARKGLADEARGTFYAVLETPTGHAYHVPLGARAAEALREGDLVTFRTQPEPTVREMDVRIAQRARESGGLFALGASLPPPERERVVRRLQQLQRLGLVQAQGPDRWSVVGDLVQRLEDSYREEPPRHRLRVDKMPLSLDAQVRHRGPAWLDDLEGSGLAPYGFGAEVGRAVDRRREVLRAFGIAPDHPDRADQLREVERRAVGEGMAARTGQAFVAKTPDRFRGRVMAGPEEAPYVIVSDGARFVLIPASREVRALSGKAVELGHDERGRLVVRAPDRDRGRDR